MEIVCLEVEKWIAEPLRFTAETTKQIINVHEVSTISDIMNTLVSRYITAKTEDYAVVTMFNGCKFYVPKSEYDKLSTAMKKSKLSLSDEAQTMSFSQLGKALKAIHRELNIRASCVPQTTKTWKPQQLP